MKYYKFLILGSNGLLGKKIVKYLTLKKYTTFKIAKKKSDYNINLLNFKKLNKLFLKYNFDIVINCAAKVSIDYCENNYQEALNINYRLVNFLAKLSNKFKFRFVQISTDHVYRGKKNLLNTEKSKIYGSNKYSLTKIRAEKAMKKLKNSVIVRTNFTGKKKNSYFDWLINNIKNKRKINLFNDMYTSTLDVDTCSKTIIKLSLTNLQGIYNIGTKDMLSKKEFAIKLAQILKKPINYQTVSCDTLKVKRGKNLGLDVSKIEKKLKIKMINSSLAIKNLIKEYK